MSTQRSATVYITNNSGGNAEIILFHNNSSNGTQRGVWTAAPGQTVGPMTVSFETGIGSETILDYWAVSLHVKDGAAPGLYTTEDSVAESPWIEDQLESADADQKLTFSVSTTELDVKLNSGATKGAMKKIAPSAQITHVFVVMLENHSFDNIFGMSGISGIKGATASDSNSYNGTTYPVQNGAPQSLTTDPGHEFSDVVTQLGGPSAKWTRNEPYPPINNSGFVASYATSTTEHTGLPSAANLGDVMACFDTPTQLPVIYQLATTFAICDQWFSSLPGPTWPNRFFVHGASSSGLDDSPSSVLMAAWELPAGGFKYANDSIYGALKAAGIPYRFYHDTTTEGQSLYSTEPQLGSAFGAVPQVTSLSGVTLAEPNSLASFANDLQAPYPYPYTFIEPHYGNVRDNSYRGGSSQHPMDDITGGERLLAAVYEAIRSSPYWNTSLLIITYDEHGGFYDSEAPGPAVPPGDNPSPNYNTNGFLFDRYGVRVPAVVVSPLIPASAVDHTLYDHASVLKTVEELFGLAPLTERDKAANGVLGLLSLRSPRTDCPTSLRLPAPTPTPAKPQSAVQMIALPTDESLPQTGNFKGTMQTLLKADQESSGGTPSEIAAIKEKFQSIKTAGEAEAYAASVLQKVQASKNQRNAALPRRPGR